MTDDRRLSPRKRIAIEVRIERDLLVARPPSTTRDIGLGGAFVEIADLRLPVEALIEAVLNIPHNGEAREYRLTAEVVRVTAQGVALKFRGYDNQTYAALMQLLHGDG